MTPLEKSATIRSMYKFDVKVQLDDGSVVKWNKEPLSEPRAIQLVRALITCGVDQVINDLTTRFYPPGQIKHIDMVRAFDPEIDNL